MQKHDHFIEKAREQRDTNLRRFYYNVAQGYEMRARALSLEEAQEVAASEKWNA